MYKIVDLIGQRNCSLTIIGKADKDTRLNRIMWTAQCDCGKQIKVCTGDWNAGRAKSCGCYRSRKGSEHPNFRHGLTKTNEYQYKIRLKRKYGINADAYMKMYEKQNGTCAICGTDRESKRGYMLAVDHCHKTGKVRGLLCHMCNTGIGLLQDNVGFLYKAADYLMDETTDVFT